MLGCRIEWLACSPAGSSGFSCKGPHKCRIIRFSCPSRLRGTGRAVRRAPGAPPTRSRPTHRTAAYLFSTSTPCDRSNDSAAWLQSGWGAADPKPRPVCRRGYWKGASDQPMRRNQRCGVTEERAAHLRQGVVPLEDLDGFVHLHKGSSPSPSAAQPLPLQKIP